MEFGIAILAITISVPIALNENDGGLLKISIEF